ncbi:MAG: hypothetical protein J0I12_05810 [Candidatus Eremiobacteraeota bacterium]|nr:hypothetical protein [Candidatus Eremiobacteraeota bacterium]
MLQKLKDIINHVASRLGIQIRRTNAPDYWRELSLDLIVQLENSLRESTFTELPPRARRAELMARLAGTTATRALYLVGYLNQCHQLSGDVCEFGVARGQTTAIMANEIRDSNKLLWLFDSFQGLPQPTEKDILIDDVLSLGSMEKYAGRMSWTIESVQNRLREVGFSPARYVIQPGYFEDTVKYPDRLPKSVSFAFVDFDFYVPIKTVLHFLHTCLVDSAIVVVDDYDFFSSGAKTAVDEFLLEYPNHYELIMPPPSAGKFCILRFRRGA